MRRLLTTVAKGKRIAALLLVPVILAAVLITPASVTPASASTTAWVEKPFITTDVANFFSGGSGTQWGQSYVRYARIKPFVQVIVHLQGVQPNHTYCFVLFLLISSNSALKTASNGVCENSPVPGVTTNSNGDGFTQFHLTYPNSGGFALIVAGPGGTTVTGVTPYSW